MRVLRIDLNVITPKEIDEVICLLKDEQEKKEAYEKFLNTQFKVSEYSEPIKNGSTHNPSVDGDGSAEKASVRIVEELSTYKSWAPFDIPKHYTSSVAGESIRQGFSQRHPHYNNDNGSLYKIAGQLGLNAYEFDILKRIARCRKKGQFEQDLQKIKDTVDLYLKEHKQ